MAFGDTIDLGFHRAGIGINEDPDGRAIHVAILPRRGRTRHAPRGRATRSDAGSRFVLDHSGYLTVALAG